MINISLQQTRQCACFNVMISPVNLMIFIPVACFYNPPSQPSCNFRMSGPKVPDCPIWIIQFPDTQQYVAVHYTWVKSVGPKMYCYWPKDASPQLLMKRKLPANLQGWELHECIYKGCTSKCLKNS